MNKDIKINFKYLDHIDALRALSVIFVILFHINPEIFFFGYLGVDIFFVISGYVITNSIYQEQVKNKKNILSFYIKRFKRLYPVLFLVIVSFLLFYIFLSPLSGNTNFYLGSALTALFGVSNFFFINNEVNYFLSESVNPLLHTWSLGIEEQFYLIYPIFLLTIFKIFKENFNKIFLNILLITVISFSIYYFNSTIIGDFYFPLARFWEISLGCLVFFIPKINYKIKLILQIIILTIVIYCLINFNNQKIIQNYNLLTTLLTSFLIFSLRGIENNKLNIFIKKSYLPYLGRLSYSIYLWHLPILYFCEIYLSGIYMIITFLFSTLVFSLISYHKFELPLRNSNIIEKKFNQFKKNSIALVLILIFIIIGIKNLELQSIYSYLKTFNYPEAKLSKFLKRLDFRHENYLQNKCKYDDLTLECLLSHEKSHAVYLTGDSHANHFLLSIDGINYLNKFFYNEIGDCEIIGKYLYKKSFNNNKCKNQIRTDKFIKKFNELEFENKTLILSLRLSEYFKDEWKIKDSQKDSKLNKKRFIKKKYNEFIDKFNTSNIILVTTVPESQIHTEKCIFNEFLGKNIDDKIFNKCHFKKKIDINRNNLIKNFLYEIVKNKSNVFIYDPYEKLCPDELCHNYNEDKDFFMLNDKDHLSIEAGKFLSDDIGKFIKNLK